MKKPNTAEVTISFRVPKGVNAAAARRLIWNNVDNTIYPGGDGELLDACGVIKFRVGKARIVRPTKG